MTTAHRGIIAIAGLLLALPGCFDPSPPAGVLCAPDGWCPSPQRCDTFTWMCVGGGPEIDAGSPWIDAWIPPWPPPDAWVPPWPDGGTSGTGIELARQSYGPVDIRIVRALVTYIKPESELDPGGFFVQEQFEGPALFVALIPNFGGTRLAVGDVVSFRIFEMGEVYGAPSAMFIDNIVIHERGRDVGTLVQEVSSTDLVTNIYSYHSELVSASVLIESDMQFDATDTLSAQVSTDAVIFNESLRVRVPTTLQDVVGLEYGCRLRVAATPVWTDYLNIYFLLHAASDLVDVDCPPAGVSNLTAEIGTELRIEFNRALDPSTVAPDGSQFTFDNGLAATSAAVSGRVVTVTTTPQVQGQSYTLTIAAGVRDIFGRDVGPVSYSFDGGRSRADVRINEVKLNVFPGCALVELRVVEPGNLLGYDLRFNSSIARTFGSLEVRRDDLVVVHFGGTSGICRRSGSGDETLAPDELPRSMYASNFDGAFDWYASRVGTIEPSVLYIRDDQDRILDAVMLTDGVSQTTEAPLVNAAALVAQANQWFDESGSLPTDGFVDGVFHLNAVSGIDVDGVSVILGFEELDGKRSIQRTGNDDNDHKGDWGTAVHSFGALNPGQSPL